MEILAVGGNPKQPIGAKRNVKICKCGNVLHYTYQDIWVRHLSTGHEINCITCPSCKATIHVSKYYK